MVGLITNIKAVRTDYVRLGESWVVVGTNITVVDSRFIDSMINAQPYLETNGGESVTKYKHIHKIGKVVSSIDVIASDGQSRCVYRFNYAEALVDGENITTERGYSVLSGNSREVRAYI